MEIRDTSPPDDAAPDRSRSGADGARQSGLGGSAEDRARPDGLGSVPTDNSLHAALRGLVDGLPPLSDPMAGVLKRVRRLQRRRRATRISASTAVLTLALVFGPGLVGAVQRWHHPGEVAAAPPAAVLDLTVAYPTPEEPAIAARAAGGAAGDAPLNALTWPARGAALPTAALDLARSYLLTEAKVGGSRSVDGAVANQVWAELEPDKQTWLYAIEGWTVGPEGAASAQILAGEFVSAAAATPAKGKGPATARATPPEMTVFATPVRFAHPAPETSPDPQAAARIAEYSIWLPASNRLLVLGAPQVQTVYYAKDGSKFVAEPTRDGVALFSRGGKAPGRGTLADLVQVRDSRNQALTPPVGWSTPDLSMTGPGAFYLPGAGWTGIPGTVPATTTVPATPVPSGSAVRPVPSATTPGRPGLSTAPTAAGSLLSPTGLLGGTAAAPSTDPNGGPSQGPSDSATAAPTDATPSPAAGTPVVDPSAVGVSGSPWVGMAW